MDPVDAFVGAQRSPFPWFGGKSRAVKLIWDRLGDVPNYVEPFFGSGAILLNRPHAPRCETVNDKDAYLSNFWRSVQQDPDGVAYFADWPVNEADLHARHRWLVTTATKRTRKVMRNPHYYDTQVAGYWVGGQCLWIGSDWCNTTKAGGPPQKIMSIDRGGRGVSRSSLTGQSANWMKRPQMKRGVAAGIHADRYRRPNMGGKGGGQGVYSPRLSQQMPQLSGDGSGSSRGLLSDGIQWGSAGLYGYMNTLGTRMRRARVCCGDWSRICKPSVTTYVGLTALVLDPPYDHALRDQCYSVESNISAEVRRFAIENGDNPQMRIVLCGYEHEHGPYMPPSWECVPWKAGGGYARSDRAVSNRDAERLWFSPHCLRPADRLF